MRVRYWSQIDTEDPTEIEVDLERDELPPLLKRRLRSETIEEMFSAFYEWHMDRHTIWWWVRPCAS